MSRCISLLAILLASVAVIFASPAVKAADRTNVVLILVDDLGWADVGCYGNKWIETPNLDRMAREGVRFTDFYAACPVCSPTRASIQSGQYQARFHLTNFIPGHWRPFEKVSEPPNAPNLPLPIVTVAETLKKAGYATGYFGKWHLGGRSHYPDKQGYDDWIVTGGRHYAPFSTTPKTELKDNEYVGDFLTDRTVEFIENHKDEPFFVQLSHYEVHIPLDARYDLLQKYNAKSPPDDGGDDGGIYNPRYAAMVEHSDRSTARVLKKLKDLGLDENTLVIYTSDNGGLISRYDGGEEVTTNRPLRGEKGALYEGGIRVPMIVRWPGRVKAGIESDEPASTIDLYPTIAAATGAKLPAEYVIDGKNLLPLMTDDGRESLDREAIFWHYPHYHHSRPASAVRAGAWKLIEFLDDGSLELYDLEKDIGESNNLAKSNADKARELKEQLHEWRKQVGALMPQKNPKYDPEKADQWWSRRSKQPLPGRVGFQSLFNGKDLTGWKGDPKVWSVRDGAITAVNTKENPVDENKFIVWEGGEIDNFELTLSFKITGPPGANSGVQIRSQVEPDGHVVGYQADIDRAKNFLGVLYDERGRGLLATRGEKVVLTGMKPAEKSKRPELVKRVAGNLGDAKELAAGIDLDKWNEYTIIARGNTITTQINDVQMTEVTDRDEQHRELKGVLALQLHSGPPMTVQFKNIRLKPLGDSQTFAARRRAEGGERRANDEGGRGRSEAKPPGSPTPQTSQKSQPLGAPVGRPQPPKDEIDENIVKIWKFEKDVAGWKPLRDVELTSKAGVLLVKGIGDDPHFHAAVEAPPGWKELTIRARFRGGRDGQIYWTTTKNRRTSEQRSVRFNIRSRGKHWGDYRVYFKPEAELTGLRIDPHSRPGVTEFESITLTNNAPPTDEATHPGGLKVADGFKVELLYSVPKHEQGSWVSMCVDPKGRLITCDQYGGLYRVTVAGRGEDGGLRMEDGAADADASKHAEPRTDPESPAAETESLKHSITPSLQHSNSESPAPSTQHPAPIHVEPLNVQIGGAQGTVWAFDALYVVVNGSKADGPGLYRVTDTNNDDKLDRVELLTKLTTLRVGVEHGPHGIVVSPDGKSLYVVAGNMTSLPENTIEPARHRNWGEDHLLKRNPSSTGHASNVFAPAGWVAKVDPEGKQWELIAAGFRNPYDLAFNTSGDLFTYDADMEFDVGTPWYRPTRVCHVVSGGEFGWRHGTGKWPAYYVDSLPSVVDVGQGSPTGVVFGSGAKFPPKYQKAFFICDWTYGTMYAVHLWPFGGTYYGELEPFVSGTPLPLTDVVINPADGAMYFTIGGRRTQSGLYRVTYEENPRNIATANQNFDSRDLGEPLTEMVNERRRLETHHDDRDATNLALQIMSTSLSHEDRHVRYAARVALERANPEEIARHLFGNRFSRTLHKPDAVIQASLALARTADVSMKPRILATLETLRWDALSNRQCADLLRTYALVFIRMGKPSEPTRSALLEVMEPRFSASNAVMEQYRSGLPRRFVNHELCRLLVYLGSEHVVQTALDLTTEAVLQEDRIFYLYALRNAEHGWTPRLRRAYFQELNAVEQKAAVGDYIGGGHLQAFMQQFRKDAVAKLSDEQKTAFEAVIQAEIQTAATGGSPTPRKFVKTWKVADLLPAIEEVGRGRSYANGKTMFTAAACIKCHRFNNTGGIFGPDLTLASKRYDRKVLLRELIEPSKVVSDQYQAHVVATTAGKVYQGRILSEDDQSLVIAVDPRKPSHMIEIPVHEVDEKVASKHSIMPNDLLNTLTKEDVLDLLAYIESGGDPNHAAFTAADSTGQSAGTE